MRKIILFAILTMLICACNKATHNDEVYHKEYFQKYYDSTDTLLAYGHNMHNFEILHRAMESFPEKSAGDYAQFYTVVADSYVYNVKNDDSALVYAKAILSTLNTPALQKQYSKQYASGFFIAGLALSNLRKTQDAYNSYYDGLKFVEKQKDSSWGSKYTLSLAYSCFQLGNYREAVAYFNKSLDKNICCITKDFNTAQTSLNTIGFCYEKLQMYDSAVAAYKDAIDYINQKSPYYPNVQNVVQSAKGVVLGNLGGTYLKQNKLALAKEALNASIAINDKPGYENGDAQTAKFKLIDLSLKTNDLATAKLLLVQIEKRNDMSLKQQQHWFTGMTSYLLKKGSNAPAVNNYLQKSLLLKDSLLLESKKSDNSQEILTAFNEIKQHYDVSALQDNGRMQRLYTFFGIVFLILLFALIFLIRKNLEISRRNHKNIQNLNEQIEEKNYYLAKAAAQLDKNNAHNQRMLHVVAHDLRNPISGIAGVANILREDEEVTDANKQILIDIYIAATSSLTMTEKLLKEKNISA